MEWRGETGFCAVPVLMLLRLSHFSHVRLCATPKTAAHQAPLSLGFFQARTLEWVAISFSNAWKWKVKVQSLSRVQLLATQWTAAHQAPLSMGLSRQEYWSGVSLLSPSAADLALALFSASWVRFLGGWGTISSSGSLANMWTEEICLMGRMVGSSNAQIYLRV